MKVAVICSFLGFEELWMKTVSSKWALQMFKNKPMDPQLGC